MEQLSRCLKRVALGSVLQAFEIETVIILGGEDRFTVIAPLDDVQRLIFDEIAREAGREQVGVSYAPSAGGSGA
jgi:hypothetical protein